MRQSIWLMLMIHAGGCEGACGVDLERMIYQRHLRPYQESPLFDDRRAMRVPPPNTIPRHRIVNRPILTEGIEGNGYTNNIPVAVDRPLLNRGRERFNIYCSVCHGPTGEGHTPVADSMTLRKPPSLVDPPVRNVPAGHLFAVITNGYGFMPSYRHELPILDRWAVVAYVQTLQLARRAVLQDLPAPLRADAEAALP